MILNLQRLHATPTSTLGSLSFNGSPQCATLEDGFHAEKIPGQTRIPAGAYNLALRTDGPKYDKYLARFGPTFHKGMLWLKDISGFEFIYIHIGNTVADTEGCILIGAKSVLNKAGAYQIQSSEVVYRRIYPAIADAILKSAAKIIITDIQKETPIA